MSACDDIARQWELAHLSQLQQVIADFVAAELSAGATAAEQRQRRGNDWLMAWAKLQTCAREIEHEKQNALGAAGKHEWCCDLKGRPWAERQRKERE